MSKDRVELSDNTSISMPVRNMLAIIAAVAVGAWAYFGVLERITMLETKAQLTEKDINQHVERLEADLTQNTEFRIKWPRGEMGSLPADSDCQDIHYRTFNSLTPWIHWTISWFNCSTERLQTFHFLFYRS